MAFSNSKSGAGPQIGDFIWHLYRDNLFGRLYKPLSDHIADVEAEPEPGRETHLRLMKPVRGPLPPAFREATATYDRECAVGSKLKAAWERRWQTSTQGASGLLRLHGWRDASVQGSMRPS